MVSGTIFSLAVAIAMFGVCKGSKKRRRLSSLKISPEIALQPMAYENPHFEEPPSPDTSIEIEFIEDVE